MPYGDDNLHAYLSVAGWKKNKSVITKIFAKKTMLTEALKGLETAYAQIMKIQLDSKPKSCSDVVETLAAIEARLKLLPALPKHLQGIQKVCKQVLIDFKVNSLVPKTASLYVRQIETFAGYELKAVQSATTSYQAWVKNLEPIAKNYKKLFTGETFNFDVCLNTPALQKVLMDWLTTEHSEENLKFILAVKPNPKAVAARKIYLQYIKQGAPDQINLPNGTRVYYDKLDAAGSWTSPDWKKAVEDIKALIRRDSIKRMMISDWLQSALFKA